MNKLIFTFIEAHKIDILEEWIRTTKDENDDRVVRVVSDQVFNSTSREFADLIITNLKGDKGDYHTRLKEFAEKVVRLGWPLTFVSSGLHTFGVIVFKRMEQSGVMTIENQRSLFREFDEWMTSMNIEIIGIYATTWEKTVSLQKIALQELSAPLIPVFERITVMPLVGTIDTERAKQIMENLLKGAVKHRSEVVLIDITGVPVVDTMVAHHIIQAAEAVRLVGAKCMLCGIRPEIAQTIVSLGIDLTQFTTKNSLQKGIEAALEITNRKIVNMEGLK
ncbi:RsbT co-antagonist protein RsbRA [Mesobacillus maritimus]|uniref:STAS domain-containing protein n=1 Tax=Mesobacillus maritimus TaxID=1643336 RepID=A0ABS7KBA5_9BACI|nr:RsbT co-antagonist protein RsbRA [Mesobacillus maritimus]MBY0099559.1 STAS domain-containing protein [Mesobacillus maritimus]